MTWGHRIAGAMVAALALSVGAAQAQGAKTGSPAELARLADQLEPGEWVWASQIAPKGPLLVYVDLSRQLATVYRNGVRIAVTTISSGREGYETPTGVFTILQKDADHRSNKYNSAPMPYQQRLTWDGVALHAGGLPGYPESHGCVHMPMGFAQALFGDHQAGRDRGGGRRRRRPHADQRRQLLAPIDASGTPVRPGAWRRRLPLDAGASRRGTADHHRLQAATRPSWCCATASRSGAAWPDRRRRPGHARNQPDRRQGNGARAGSMSACRGTRRTRGRRWTRRPSIASASQRHSIPRSRRR
jgi:hypothetical protein